MSDRAKIWYNTLVVSVKDASFGLPVFFGHMKEEMPLTLREEAPMGETHYVPEADRPIVANPALAPAE